MDRLVSGRAAPKKPFVLGMHNAPVIDKSQDPVESILQSQEQFESVQQSNQALVTLAQKGGTASNITKVITLLLKEDKRKLLETIKKLNARQ